MDCGKRAGNIEIVVHCLSECFGEFFGTQEQFLRACFTYGLNRAGDKSGELFPCCVRIREGIRPPLDGTAVVHGRESPTHCSSWEILREGVDREHISQGLRHFFTLGGHPCVVDPQAREVPAGSVRLSLLVFVVREAQIDSSAVDIKRFTQVAVRHCRALEVPARAPLPPRGIPRGRGWFFGLCSLPKREVARILLPRLGCRIDLRFVFRRSHILKALVRERTIVLLRTHTEVHVSRAIAVCVAAVNEPLNECDLLGNMTRCARLIGRFQNAKLLVCGGELAFETLSPRPPRNPGLSRLIQDFVVDISDIANVGHFQTCALEPANQ